MSAQGPLRDGRASGLSLIETMRWEPLAGIVRRDLHMARLAQSADALGFPLDRAELVRALDEVTGQCMMRVRLLLTAEGQFELTAQPYDPLPLDTIWRLRIAQTRLDRDDPLLRHKTTMRGAYEQARAEYSREQADEVILLNAQGEVCEGTITSIFVPLADGTLATPPLSCGLLAGVLRAELIAAGRAREMVLQLPDLANAKGLLVGNSLRGLVRTRLDTGEEPAGH